MSEERKPIPPTAGILGRQMCFDPARARSRAMGAFFGMALGDALGLQAEGMETPQVSERHPGGLNLPYKGLYWGHATGDWTDATDFAVLVARSLAAYFAEETEDTAVDFAKRVVGWNKKGFPELNDAAGIRPEGVVMRALADGNFIKDPAATARALKGAKTDNGSVFRSVACAFTAAPEEWAVLFSEATHGDTRATAAAVTFALLLNRLIMFPPSPRLIEAPARVGRAQIQEPQRQKDFMAHLTETRRLSQLKLGDRDNRSYCLKTLSCAVWALRQLMKTREWTPDFFKATVRAVATEGGDASANAAVAGAVLGAAMGIENLPLDWIEATPHREWLRKEVEAFLKAAEPTWELPDDSILEEATATGNKILDAPADESEASGSNSNGHSDDFIDELYEFESE